MEGKGRYARNRILKRKGRVYPPLPCVTMVAMVAMVAMFFISVVYRLKRGNKFVR